VSYGETFGLLSLLNLQICFTTDVVREWKNLSSNANWNNESACVVLSCMRTIVDYGETFGLLSLRNLLLCFTTDLVREWKNLNPDLGIKGKYRCLLDLMHSPSVLTERLS